MLHLLIDEIARTMRASLYTEQNQTLAPFVHGEVVPLGVSIINRIPNVSAGQLWLPRSLSTTAVRVGLGKSFQLPVAGTLTLTFGANTTAALSFLPTAAEVAAALNLLASVIAAGGVTVTSPAPGYYFVTFTVAGVRALITGDETNLAPLSVIDIQTLIAGDVGQRAVQTIRIVQNPGAFVSMVDAIPESAIAVDVLEVGGGGANHKVRVTIDPIPYAGKFTFRVQASETDFLDWQISETDFRTAIENLESVGTGNVSVVKEAGSSWVVMFINELADTDMTVDIVASGAALQSIPGKTGNLDLRTAGIELLLSNAEQVAATLEVEIIPAGGYPFKALQYAGLLRDAIIDPSSTQPPPRLFAGFDSLVDVPAAVDSAGLPGNVAYDENFEYRYVGDGVAHAWRRKALAVWA